MGAKMAALGERDALATREGERGSFAPLRVVGYLLYCAWLLSAFYNDFLYRATPDFRSALYINTLLSLIVLACTILIFPLIERRADKWVLSRRCILISGIVFSSATALLCLSNAATTSGRALVALSSLGTGIGSGLLFLGWGRLYADVGTRVALIEMSSAWAGAALLCVALSTVAPTWLACGVVVVGAFASAVLLRRCTFSRPARPHPSRPHQLQRRTRRLFARGMAGCAAVGVVSGFSDVLSGYRFLAVPDHYAAFLALGCAAVGLLLLLVGLRSRHEFVTYAYRIVALLLVVGCQLVPFMAHTDTMAYAVMLGAYISFTILLCVVCIDVSNYFDRPATKTFGLAFFALYLGEISGNGLSHLLTDAVRTSIDLSIIAVVLTVVVAVSYLFLFTEKDLVETSLGEMTDDEEQPGRAHVFGWGVRIGSTRTSTGNMCTGDDSTRAAEAASCPVAAASGVGPCAAAADGSCPQAGTVWSTCPAGVSVALAGVGRTPSASDQQASIEEISAVLAERFELTPREADVLPLIIRGRTIARIQEELHISQGTVGTHMRHIYQKAGVRNRQGLLDLIDELAREEGGA